MGALIDNIRDLIARVCYDNEITYEFKPELMTYRIEGTPYELPDTGVIPWARWADVPYTPVYVEPVSETATGDTTEGYNFP